MLDYDEVKKSGTQLSVEGEISPDDSVETHESDINPEEATPVETSDGLEAENMELDNSTSTASPDLDRFDNDDNENDVESDREKKLDEPDDKHMDAVEGLKEEPKTTPIPNKSIEDPALAIELLTRLTETRNAVEAQNKWISQALSTLERFRTNTLNSLQKEVELYRKKENTGLLLPIIKPLVSILANYEFVLDQIQEDSVKDTLLSFYEEMDELLENFGVKRCEHSNEGDRFSARRSTKRKIITTDDKNLDGKVACSLSPAYILDANGDGEMRVLVREIVDVYSYKEPEPVDDNESEPHQPEV